ncbi:catalase A [Coemansia spiralis]|uniref:Catalase A n=1 Tax=Coemansia spiralis TaxID=417178 RepID=A0A9W8GA98_9FUNG|nr:catalase A [Coemansia spiralis]
MSSLQAMARNPVDDNQNSLTAGEFGLILLQDLHIIAKLTHIDLKRIFKHAVHANSAGAHGRFASHLRVMKEEGAANYKWNVFDDTKVWSCTDCLFQKIDKLAFDRNPSNYFVEVEQAAFSPSSMVPGIDVSNDRVVQGHLFLYADCDNDLTQAVKPSRKMISLCCAAHFAT